MEQEADEQEGSQSKPSEDSESDAAPREFAAPRGLKNSRFAIDIQDFEAQQRQAMRRRALWIRFGIIGIAVVAPFLYLIANGTFSTAILGRKPASTSSPAPLNANGTPQANTSTSGTSTGTSKGGTATKTKGAKGGALEADPFVGMPTATATPKKSVRDPAIAKDLERYIYSQLKSATKGEQTALTAFASVTGNNFKKEADTFRVLRTQVIPPYTRFVAQVSAIKPQTRAVQNLHKLLVHAARLRLMAYRHMLEGEHDYDALWQYGVKTEFEQADKFTQEFRSNLAGLAAEQEVKLP